MEIADNQQTMTNGYPISEWELRVPLLDDDEHENEIANAM